MSSSVISGYSSVSAEEDLYRRSYSEPQRNFLNPDGSATSRVFRLREKDNGQLSVDIKSLTTAQVSIKDKSKFMLFEISVSTVVGAGLAVYHDPYTEKTHGEDNIAHSFIWGLTFYPDPADRDDTLPGLLARASVQVSV